MLPVITDLEQLARQAGDILRLGYEKDHQVEYKSAIDPVTEVDRQSETFLLAEIQHRFPGHQIVSEEVGLVPGSSSDQWYVDPLDGTVNYTHGIPIFSVSIAYSHNGMVVLGAVYDPMRDELFSAERGQGARMNGRPLHVSRVSDLEHSLLVTGFPYDIRTTAHDNLDNYARFARLSQGVRRLGSAALDLCYVAAGRFQAYWELSIMPWDVAAGALIAAEAGARVTSATGEADFITPPASLLAASPDLYPKMKSILENRE
jgi:myo-inositol-1(or 4)-monophosphatase